MAYQEAMEKARPDTISDTFKALAMALIAKVGGASGPLYGSAFLELAKATKTIASIDSLPQLGELLEQGVLGIQGRGKAQLDDKTMVDVWLPVIAALKAGYLEETVISSAKEHTAELVAKKGRASYLGERAVGHIDPGAASSALLFETLLPYLK